MQKEIDLKGATVVDIHNSATKYDLAGLESQLPNWQLDLVTKF